MKGGEGGGAKDPSRESTCAGDDDEEQRACHRVTNVRCKREREREGSDSSVSRWRGGGCSVDRQTGGFETGDGGRKGEEEDGGSSPAGEWMDGRVVSYQGRAGSTTLREGGGGGGGRGVRARRTEAW